MLKPGGTYGEGDEALEFYAKHTAQIEVRCQVPVRERLYGFGAFLLLSRHLTRFPVFRLLSFHKMPELGCNTFMLPSCLESCDVVFFFLHT